VQLLLKELNVTPDQMAKSNTEHGEQSALFCWANMACRFGYVAADDPGSYLIKGFAAAFNAPSVPELEWFHAIPNGGARGDSQKTNMIRGGQLKAEGVKRGVSDTLLPVKRGQYCGLYIEMKKRGCINKTTPEQKKFGAFVQSQGYGFIVIDNWRIAADTLKAYLEQS
jgi:hypothetical protein